MQNLLIYGHRVGANRCGENTFILLREYLLSFIKNPFHCPSFSQFPLLAFKGSLVDPQMRASNEHLPSVRVPRAGGRPGCPSHPSEAARCASTEDHQAPSPPLFCEQEAPYEKGDGHAGPARIYPATPTTKISEVTRHSKEGVQCSRDSQECKWSRTIST